MSQTLEQSETHGSRASSPAVLMTLDDCLMILQLRGRETQCRSSAARSNSGDFHDYSAVSSDNSEDNLYDYSAVSFNSSENSARAQRHRERRDENTPPSAGRQIHPPIRMYRYEDHHAIYLELPGFKAGHVRVEVQDSRTIMVCGSTSWDPNLALAWTYAAIPGRPFRYFRRSIPLAIDIERVMVRASLEDGLLRIVLRRRI